MSLLLIECVLISGLGSVIRLFINGTSLDNYLIFLKLFLIGSFVGYTIYYVSFFLIGIGYTFIDDNLILFLCSSIGLLTKESMRFLINLGSNFELVNSLITKKIQQWFKL